MQLIFNFKMPVAKKKNYPNTIQVCCWYLKKRRARLQKVRQMKRNMTMNRSNQILHLKTPMILRWYDLFFLESDSCVLFLFIGVWEGESFNCLSIQQRNIPSVNFYGTNPSVELAMIKIQEKIAATKVSFSF